MVSDNLTNVRFQRMPLVRIALRNVTRNRRRSALTLFAIAMSVMVVITVRGALNGLQNLLKEKVVLGQVGVLQVHKSGFVDNVKKSPLSFGFEATPELLKKIGAVPGVTAAAPRLGFATMANHDDTTLFTMASGIDPVLEYEVCPKKRQDVGVITATTAVVAPDVERQLALTARQELTLMAPDFEGVLNAANITVGGVMRDAPAFSGDKKIVYVPLAVAQELLRMPGQVTEIAVRAADLEHPESAAKALAAALGPGFEVHTWKDLAQFVVDALGSQEVALSFVIVIFMVVALLGIANTMLMSVLERTREIGTMMAVGVKRAQILALFVLEAALLAGFGALVGAGLGVFLVNVMHSVGLPVTPPGSSVPDFIHPVIQLRFIAKVVSGAMLGAAIAAVYPAFRASRLKPVQALAAI